jgi:hypothetical protein
VPTRGNHPAPAVDVRTQMRHLLTAHLNLGLELLFSLLHAEVAQCLASTRPQGRGRLAKSCLKALNLACCEFYMSIMFMNSFSWKCAEGLHSQNSLAEGLPVIRFTAPTALRKSGNQSVPQVTICVKSAVIIFQYVQTRKRLL